MKKNLLGNQADLPPYQDKSQADLIGNFYIYGEGMIFLR